MRTNLSCNTQARSTTPNGMHFFQNRENNFDITLLTILLKNICRLPKPGTGWNVMLPTGDTSKSADVVRIKLFRNEICGHTARAQLDDAKFETL